MRDFIAAEDRALLERHALTSFEALWLLELDAVDEPNTERGGFSSVSRLELDGRAFYLKRQTNHLTRSLLHPFGEPTFAREFRNIQRYHELGIPALEAVFFAVRKQPGAYRAILLTRALDGWVDLQQLLQNWDTLPVAQQVSIIQACARLAHCLHSAGQMHACFYPKHIFLREELGVYQACLIDLEKTRPLYFGLPGRVKDIEPLLRRAAQWSEAEVRLFLHAYLGSADAVDAWLPRLALRKRNKESRQ